MSKISIESEQDKAIKILGECLCECRICLATGQCNKEDCPYCTKGRMIDNCISRLDDFNILAVNRAANVEYNSYANYIEEMKRNTKIKMMTSAERCIRKAIGFIGSFSIFITIVLLLSLFFFNSCQSNNMWMYKPPSTVKQQLRQQNTADFIIYNHIQRAKASIRDVNRDGKIDCIDYTVTFKRYWDDFYRLQGLEGDCIIMQNVNPNNGFNHAFIMIRQTIYPFNYVCVEPQADSYNNMYMKDMWGDRYDPAYDTYDYEKIRYWYDKCIY